MAENLRRRGAANINFVGGDPIPNIHNILEGMNKTRVNVPMLWNSDMYMTEEAMSLLWDVIDIWLPDFKFGNDSCARRLSRVRNYFEVVSRNHVTAHRGGDMIIRHLVMPNHIECCTKPVLTFIAENLEGVMVNIMGQYRPEYLVRSKKDRYRDIFRGLRRQELDEARRFAERMGIVYDPVS
jgi:putative pyruvate formate lyase activating enzyme